MLQEECSPAKQVFLQQEKAKIQIGMLNTWEEETHFDLDFFRSLWWIWLCGAYSFNPRAQEAEKKKQIFES